MSALHARASMAGYFVLCGIWVFLGVVFTWVTILDFQTHYSLCVGSPTWSGILLAGVSWLCALGWGIWLRGFRLTITDDVFEYRDGFYRTRSVRPVEITHVESTWITWKALWREIKVPRIEVRTQRGDPIWINAKPFSRDDLKVLLERFKGITDRKAK